MKRRTLQLVELPPFKSFIISGKSPRTFGFREFFSKPNYDLELIVSDKSNVNIVAEISKQENKRSSIDAIIQGVGGAGVGLGVMATAGVVGVCPACYPIYAALIPIVGVTAAGLFVVPAGYITLSRLGQKKIIEGLDKKLPTSQVRTLDYRPLLEIISERDLSKHIVKFERIKSQPRSQRDRQASKIHKEKAYEGLIELQRKSHEIANDEGVAWNTLSNAYGYAAKSFGKNRGFSKPVIIKPTQYKPIKRSTLALAGIGATVLITGGILWATNTNPLDLVNSQNNKVIQHSTKINSDYHIDEFTIQGMTCTECATTIERSLENSPLVRDATIYLQENKGIVEYNGEKLTHEELLQLVPTPYSITILDHKNGENKQLIDKNE